MLKCSHNIVAIFRLTDKNSQHSEYIFSSHGATAPSGSGSHNRGFKITLTHFTRQGSSGRVIALTQRPVPYNTQHSQETDTHAPGVIQTHNPNYRSATDHAFDRAATRIGSRMYKYSLLFLLRQWTVTKYETNPKLSHVTVALQKPGFIKLLVERSCLWLLN